MEPDERLAVERAALALLDDVLDLPETQRSAWIGERTADEAVKARLAAMLEADRISSLRTGAAVLGLGSAPLPERIGHYGITGLIGRGGMGAVYRGVRDSGDFAHEVAIKVIKPGLLSDQLTERFRAERQTLATLNHPNIARLYDGGETSAGHPFMVMELVDGMAIDRWADANMLSVDARARLLETVAAAIGHAHQRLVIHRDITPLNVLVTADGVVKLIDFGIARASDSEGVTTAVDIAGMGRLLRRLLPEAPSELAAVIAKATHEDQGQRYATAEAFAADLAAWRTGFPVAAMGGGRREAVAKFVARHRLGVAASVLFVLALAGALVAVVLANGQAEAARMEAEARFERTRGIAKALLFEAFDAVSQVPGATAARNVLAETGATYLDELAAMEGAPPDVVAEAARGYVRLAEVIGGGQVASLGRHADANALLAKAEALLGPLWAARPDDPAVARAYAALRLEQAGTDLYNNNAADRARERAAEAEAVLQPVAAVDADSARMTLAAIQAQGDSFGWNDAYQQALPHHLRAEAFAAGLPAAIQADRGVMAARSGNLRLLAEAHHKQKQPVEARAANDAAIALNRRLVALEPDNPAWQRKLTQALWYAAVVHRTNMRDAEARAAITESLALGRGLVARDPADMAALRMLAVVGEVMAQVEMDAGQNAASTAMSDEVLAMHQRMVAAAGDAPGALRSMTSALRTTGGNRYMMGDVAGACRIWRQAAGNYAAMQARGQLTELDANNGYPEIAGYVRSICEGGARPKVPWEE